MVNYFYFEYFVGFANCMICPENRQNDLSKDVNSKHERKFCQRVVKVNLKVTPNSYLARQFQCMCIVYAEFVCIVSSRIQCCCLVGQLSAVDHSRVEWFTVYPFFFTLSMFFFSFILRRRNMLYLHWTKFFIRFWRGPKNILMIFFFVFTSLPVSVSYGAAINVETK